MRSTPIWRAMVVSAAMALWLGGCGEGGGGAGTTSGGGSGARGQDRPLRVAFVTNQVADFWNIAEAGAKDAAREFELTVDVRMPAEATGVEQQRIVEDLLTSGIDAIAISPVDAENQRDLLNRAASRVSLITHDSDAPNTDRLAYIGMDNYQAGRMCGELVKRALPDGGKVMLFIGRLEQDNSKYRRQGVIDELLDRPYDRTRFDPVDGEIRGDKYVILDTRTDQGDANKAKDNAEDAISAHPDLAAMVGLFEYNPPACYQALQQAGKLGEIKLIGFDENSVTLQAIKDGLCIGTVVQDPYEYGYKSVKVLAGLLRGMTLEDLDVDASRFVNIPARMITVENVDEYWADLKAKTGR